MSEVFNVKFVAEDSRLANAFVVIYREEVIKPGGELTQVLKQGYIEKSLGEIENGTFIGDSFEFTQLERKAIAHSKTDTPHDDAWFREASQKIANIEDGE